MSSLSQITRLLSIINKLKSIKYFTKKELLDEINTELRNYGYPTISLRSLERDFEVITKPPFGINIIYTKHKGYRIGEKTYNGIEIEQVLEPFEVLTALNMDTGISKVVITEKYSSKGTQHLSKLINAIRDHKIVSFSYGKYSSTESSNRTIAPYNIKQVKGQWYLIGHSLESDEIRTFGLDRMDDLKITHKFKRDETISITEKFKYSYGIYSGDEYPIEDIVLSFDKADGNYLKTVPLHSSQEILVDTDDEFQIKLKLRLTEDFVMAIVSRSWSLKVIQPASLRERVCNIYRDALNRNSANIAPEK